MGTPVRLQRYLASAGVSARRKAEELITAGRVKVNGKIVNVLGSKIDPDHDSVEVDGEAVVALDKFYVLLNKPKACITAVTDDRGRPTVMDYLPNLPVPVKPVGRLDFYTEGVLLLTNDGELAARLLAPANHVPKTYHVKVHGQLSTDDVKLLREGIQLDDGTTTMPAEVEILPGESKYTWLAITIHEGKHRQIHRMIEALGYQVDKLQRVAFANLSFHDLRVGDARELTQGELNTLRDIVGLDHSSVARGSWNARRERTDIPRRARAKARAEAEAELAEREAREAQKAREPAHGPDDLDDWVDELDADDVDAAPDAGDRTPDVRGGRDARGSVVPARSYRGLGDPRGGEGPGRDARPAPRTPPTSHRGDAPARSPHRAAPARSYGGDSRSRGRDAGPPSRADARSRGRDAGPPSRAGRRRRAPAWTRQRCTCAQLR
ncbi:MAG: pseudouridine synthase [Deltaproteobacteria bacterium]|nr:pseudouridine synthase [Deltaproteobacteria bacterium]